jgi:hypothetical protein
VSERVLLFLCSPGDIFVIFPRPRAAMKSNFYYYFNICVGARRELLLLSLQKLNVRRARRSEI